MGWYRQGQNVNVLYFDDSRNVYHAVKIHGKKPAKPLYNEHSLHCKAIADTLEEYVDGRVYKCSECGEIITVPYYWSGEKYKCPDCGTIQEQYELEPLTLWDYFEDMLDVNYTVNYKKEYKAARVLVAYGGPNIYIDTLTGDVELYWWTESGRYPMKSDVIEEIDNYFSEVFECI
jgi:predicted RNA-binding Zn-ribbon protein involved in translation (DUF1610 family)